MSDDSIVLTKEQAQLLRELIKGIQVEYLGAWDVELDKRKQLALRILKEKS